MVYYTISKDDQCGWYAHMVGFSYIPSFISGRSVFGTKKYALENAGLMMGLLYKDYMQLRKESPELFRRTKR